MVIPSEEYTSADISVAVAKAPAGDVDMTAHDFAPEASSLAARKAAAGDVDMTARGYAPEALLFAGQGRRLEGLGLPVLTAFPQAAARLEHFSAVCGQNVEALLRGTVPAEDTRGVHVALMAYVLLLREYMPRTATLLAGHSYGEVLALAYAGALSAEDALHLADARGSALARVCAEQDGGMLAAFAAPVAELEKIVLCWQQDSGEDVWPVNYNAPEQLVVAGRAAALRKLATVLKQSGCGVLPLPTAGAFHSPLMRPAAEALFAAASRLRWQRPDMPVLSSVTARVLEGRHFAAHLAMQMVRPVRWLAVMDVLRRAGVQRVREIGAGNTLCRLCVAVPDWQVQARPVEFSASGAARTGG